MSDFYNPDPRTADYHEREGRRASEDRGDKYLGYRPNFHSSEPAPEDVARVVVQLAGAALGRKCGECTACCTTLAIEELRKPVNVACPHVCATGCQIYPERPQTCQDFLCTWRMGLGDDSMRPDRSGFLLTNQTSAQLFTYGMGEILKEPVFLCAFQMVPGAFLTPMFTQLRAAILRSRNMLVGLYRDGKGLTVWSPRFPQGTWLEIIGEDDEWHRSWKVRIPE